MYNKMAMTLIQAEPEGSKLVGLDESSKRRISPYLFVLELIKRETPQEVHYIDFSGDPKVSSMLPDTCKIYRTPDEVNTFLAYSNELYDKRLDFWKENGVSTQDRRMQIIWVRSESAPDSNLLHRLTRMLEYHRAVNFCISVINV